MNANPSLKQEVSAELPWLFQELGLQITESGFNPKSFGDSFVILASPAGPTSTRLAPDGRMQRWKEVRGQLSANPNRDKIIRVLESPASGERFHWLD